MTENKRPYCQHCKGKGWFDGLEIPCRWCNPGGEFRSLGLGTTAPAPPTQTEGEHPEDFCKKCGRPNIVWFAPNEIWNQAVRAANEPEILCPVCFVQLAEAAGFNGVWKVALNDYVAAAPSDTAAPKCVHCGHQDKRSLGGFCNTQVTGGFCWCKCEFAEPVTIQARFIEAFRDAAFKAHLRAQHKYEWEECEWIECEDRRRLISEFAEPVTTPDNYVAWCRYTYDESGGIQSIETCDSDAPGAFRVYARSPQPVTAAARAAAREIMQAWKDWLDESDYDKIAAIISRHCAAGVEAGGDKWAWVWERASHEPCNRAYYGWPGTCEADAGPDNHYACVSCLARKRRNAAATTSPETTPNYALVQLLNAAMLHPEQAEGYIRRVIAELGDASPETPVGGKE